jgi:hypothetical protein
MADHAADKIETRDVREAFARIVAADMDMYPPLRPELRNIRMAGSCVGSRGSDAEEWNFRIRALLPAI